MQRCARGLALLLAATLAAAAAGCPSPEPRGAAPGTPERRALRIAHLTDICWSSEMAPYAEEALTLLTTRPDLDLVVLGGDSVPPGADATSLDGLVSAAASIPVPWYAALGQGEGEVLDAAVARLTGHGPTKGRPWFALDPKPGFRVVCLATHEGQVGAKQLSWLEAELRREPPATVVVVSHFPIDEPLEGAPPDFFRHFQLLDGDAVRQALERAGNVAVVLQGHVGAAKVHERGGILYCSAPAVSRYPHALRALEVEEGEVRLEWLEVRDVDLVRRGRAALAASALARGFDAKAPERFADFCRGAPGDRERRWVRPARGEASR